MFEEGSTGFKHSTVPSRVEEGKRYFVNMDKAHTVIVRIRLGGGGGGGGERVGGERGGGERGRKGEGEKGVGDGRMGRGRNGEKGGGRVPASKVRLEFP